MDLRGGPPPLTPPFAQLWVDFYSFVGLINNFFFQFCEDCELPYTEYLEKRPDPSFEDMELVVLKEVSLSFFFLT